VTQWTIDVTGSELRTLTRPDAELASGDGSAPTHSPDVARMLQRLTHLTVEATGAYRASVFRMSDDGDALILWSATARNPREERWELAKRLGPIGLDDPLRRAVLELGHPIPLPDVRASDLIPPEWCETFDIGAALVAPLAVGEQRIGVLVADWREPRPIAPGEIAVVRAIADSLAVALRHHALEGELREKTGTLERLVQLGAAIHSSLGVEEVLDKVCRGFEDLLHTSHCSVNVLDPTQRGQVRTLATTGDPWFAETPEAVTEVPVSEVRRVDSLWAASPEPVVYTREEAERLVDPDLIPASVGWAALFPLTGREGVIGFVLAGFRGSPARAANRLDAGMALSWQAATALEQARLHRGIRHRLNELEVLYTLSEVVVGKNDMTGALRALNRALQPEMGVRLEAIELEDVGLQRILGAGGGGEDSKRLTAGWRRAVRDGQPIAPIRRGRALAVPVARGRSVHGVIRARLTGDADLPDGLLLALGAGCAEVVHRAALGRSLAAAQRGLAVARERERIARDLHDSAGQVLVGLGLELAACVEDAPDEAWRERLQGLVDAASQGNDEVRGAISALLFRDVSDHGLVGAIESLLDRLRRAGVRAVLEVSGDPNMLPDDYADTLYRVAHEAVVNVERHARASTVRVELTCRHEPVLVVQDDGTGIGPEPPSDAMPRFGLREMRRRLRDLGGDVEVSDAGSGTRLTAWLPRRDRTGS
jgi:signal transduction histidine kinase